MCWLNIWQKVLWMDRWSTKIQPEGIICKFLLSQRKAIFVSSLPFSVWQLISPIDKMNYKFIMLFLRFVCKSIKFMRCQSGIGNESDWVERERERKWNNCSRVNLCCKGDVTLASHMLCTLPAHTITTYTLLNFDNVFLCFDVRNGNRSFDYISLKLNHKKTKFPVEWNFMQNFFLLTILLIIYMEQKRIWNIVCCFFLLLLLLFLFYAHCAPSYRFSEFYFFFLFSAYIIQIEHLAVFTPSTFISFFFNNKKEHTKNT